MNKILKLPYPYKAWVTISNDPDRTTIHAWREIHDLIFKQLRLPWANSIFPFSFNTNLKGQVNLKDNPEIASEPIDAIHTWGDFVNAGSRGFSRDDAFEAMRLLETHGISPKVWVDHSRFTGNYFHRSRWGSIPNHIDSSGWKYNVSEYTLDLAREIGICYIWDGLLTNLVGQDRTTTLFERVCAFKSNSLREFILNAKKHFLNAIDGNKVYWPVDMPDGNRFYVFRRFGRWDHADIIGLSNILSTNNLKTLIKFNGVMIAYTHLGKSRPDYVGHEHIPIPTRRALESLSKYYHDNIINFSSLSSLLDYLVIRDNTSIVKNTFQFKSDGIRFSALNASDFNSLKFSFYLPDGFSKIKFKIDDREVRVKLNQENKSFYSIGLIEEL